MNPDQEQFTKKGQDIIKERVRPVYRQIGGITFFVGLFSVLVGLWIDRKYDTRPTFMVISLVVSVPIVLWVNTRTLRKAIEKAADEIKQIEK